MKKPDPKAVRAAMIRAEAARISKPMPRLTLELGLLHDEVLWLRKRLALVAQIARGEKGRKAGEES